MAKVLVTGGAGYVGSATCAWLIDHGHDVWVVDDLSEGHREQVLGNGFILARIGDSSIMEPLLSRERFDCVMHFCAFAKVGESVEKPQKYFENNVSQTKALLDVLIKTSEKSKPPRFIFSSTCAIFGDPGNQDIAESTPKKPINPYGETKLEAERIMTEYAQKSGLQAIALRYFNAAGTEPKLRVGEWHNPESHLIPSVLQAAATGRPMELYGTDYPTPDGTCVRDYVHVWDLAIAHAAAMERLLAGRCKGFEAYNLGSAKGFSNREIIQACERVTGRKITVVEKPRRPGDPPRLVANSSLAQKELGFKVAPDALETIIRSAWDWKKKLMKPRKAVFLDRDGTLNEDPGYLGHPDQMKLLPGVGEALARLKQAKFQLVVISNQSGVGRGFFSESMLISIHRKLDELLQPYGVRIDHYELCLHKPEDDCECRKPKPKLLLDAAAKLNLDFSESYMVGDKVSDLGAGRAAKCRGSALVRTGEGTKAEALISPKESDFVGDSLTDVVRWILSQENAGS